MCVKKKKKNIYIYIYIYIYIHVVQLAELRMASLWSPFPGNKSD